MSAKHKKDYPYERKTRDSLTVVTNQPPGVIRKMKKIFPEKEETSNENSETFAKELAERIRPKELVSIFYLPGESNPIVVEAWQ